MRLHHGQCPRCNAKVPNHDAKIAAALATLGAPGGASGGREAAAATVGSVLPACPNASCKGAKVLFNGCQNCGHVFSSDGSTNEWHALPAWTPGAAAALALGSQARSAAKLLAAQVRHEAALLQHEQRALANALAAAQRAPQRA